MIKKPLNFQIRKNLSFKGVPNVKVVSVQDSLPNLQKPLTSNERIDQSQKIAKRTESEPGSDIPLKVTRCLNNQAVKIKSSENIYESGKNQ